MNVLQHLGLKPERVLELTRRQVVQEAIAVKGRVGRRGLPHEVVAELYHDYQRLGSISAAARHWGRTRQATWELLTNHGFKLRPDPTALSLGRPRSERVKFGRKIYTPCKRGYLRATTGRREPLAHAIWRAQRGPVPRGHQVSFLNGNFRDHRIENLFCGTAAEVTRHHQRRLHPATSLLSPAERREHARKTSLRYYYREREKRFAAGLRSDGRPRSRRLQRVPGFQPAKAARVARDRTLPPLEAAWRQFKEAA